MTDRTETLLPCPGCGIDGEEQVYEMTVYASVKQIGCVNCGMKGPSDLLDQAITKWNNLPRRHPEQPAPALRERIAEAIAADLVNIIPIPPHLLDLDINRIADIAASVASYTVAQGGIDRERLLAWLREMSVKSRLCVKVFNLDTLDEIIDAIEGTNFDLPTPAPPSGDASAAFGEWLHKLRTDYLNAGQYRENDVVNYIQIEFANRYLSGNVITSSGPHTVDMLLFCPNCSKQHLDHVKPEQNWNNPPHRSHRCDYCEHVWRPADVPTNGVAAIQTAGKADGSALPTRTDDGAGRDTQLDDIRWVVFAPNKPGRYHVQYPDGTVKIHRFIKISDGMRYDSDDTMTFHYLDELIDQRCLFSSEDVKEPK